MNALSRLVETLLKHSRHMAVSLFIVSSGCGTTGVQPKTPPQSLFVEAIAVAPIDWRMSDDAPWQRYEKNRDLVVSLSESNTVDVIAPWEFDRIQPQLQPREYQTKSNLFPRVRKMRMEPNRVLVLETTLEEDTANRTSEMTRKTLQKMDRSFDSRLHITLRLIHPASDRVVVKRDCRSIEDRFGTTPAYDNRPGIRRLLLQCLEELMAQARRVHRLKHATSSPTHPSVHTLENPSTVLDYDNGGPSLRTVLKDSDPIIRKARIYNRFRYRYPDLSSDDFERYLRLPSGLLVDTTSGTGLHPGDVITHVNGRAIQWPFQWKRAVRRAKAALSIHLVRKDKTIHLELIVQEKQWIKRKH